MSNLIRSQFEKVRLEDRYYMQNNSMVLVAISSMVVLLIAVGEFCKAFRRTMRVVSHASSAWQSSSQQRMTWKCQSSTQSAYPDCPFTGNEKLQTPFSTLSKTLIWPSTGS